jgi:hypothetical protein
MKLRKSLAVRSLLFVLAATGLLLSGSVGWAAEPGAIYTIFSGISSSSVYNFDVDIRIDQFSSAPPGSFYEWVLTIVFSDGSWAEGAFQWNSGVKQAKWAGGGLVGGSTVNFDWQVGQWYRYRVWRVGQNPDNSWRWGFWILNYSTNQETFIGYVDSNGQFISTTQTPRVSTRVAGVACTDPSVEATWRNPVYRNGGGPFTALSGTASYINSTCTDPNNTNQWLVSPSPEWKHKTNTPRTTSEGTVLWVIELNELTPQDKSALTICLNTLASGYDPTAAAQCNSILSKPEYTATAWQSFFNEYFTTNAFTDPLRDYLLGFTFGGFNIDVRRRVQMGLVVPLENIAERIMQTYPSGLGSALAGDANLRQTLFNAHRFLSHILVGPQGILGSPPIADAATKQSIYDFYRAHVGRYPNYLRADVVLDRLAEAYVPLIRAQVHVNLRDAIPMTAQAKQEIAQTLGLNGRRLDIWNLASVLVSDNLGLDSAQLDVIYNMLTVILQSLHELSAITVYMLLCHQNLPCWDNFSTFIPISRLSVNIFDIDVGCCPENGFPDDVDPYYSDLFSNVLAHEINHAVDANTIEQNPTLKARKNALIQQAGNSHMNYLRSMLPDGFFTQNPQEFFASISNQWFANSRHTLDLGVVRFRNGFREPINQALFFAEVYSQEGNTTRFYTLDTQGQLTLTLVPITRNANGHINGLTINSLTYTFELDSAGNVTSILAAPTPSAALFRVERATGNVFTDGSFNPGGADIAERIDVSEPVEPGDVVELDPNNPKHYRKARTPYSALVAGVVSTKPGILLGNRLGGGLRAAALAERQQSQEPELALSWSLVQMGAGTTLLSGVSVALLAPYWSAGDERPLLALVGRVPVKVSTENGPIQIGDLLTSSSKAGYAMRCADARRCEGAIIGKALESLEQGTGVILMLVMR